MMMRFTRHTSMGMSLSLSFPPKKSSGVAWLTGFPLEIAGENIRSSSGEQNDWVEYTYEI